MRSQRTSLVPVFKLEDRVNRVKMQVDDTFDSSGPVVVLDDDPEAGYSGWIEEAVPAVLKQLWSPPQIEIKIEDDELELNNLKFDPDTVKVI